MKKNKLIVLFLLCLLVFTCVACSKETNRETEPFTNSSEEQEETDIDQPEETPGSIDEGAVTGSDAWKALTFTLDGNTISLPADYSAFENTGWSIDPEETDTSEQLETGSGTLRVWLYNDSYSTEDVSMNIQFFNLDEETKQLLDSEVHVFDLRIEPGASSYPDLELPEGITWGATVDEIYEAYGNEAAFEDSEDTLMVDEYDTYFRLTYRGESTDLIFPSMDLYVDKEFGLYKITLSYSVGFLYE